MEQLKMKFVLLTLFTLTIYSVGNTQTMFQKTFGGLLGEWGRSGCITHDKGYALCGNSSSFVNGFDDIYVVRCNEFGDTLWTRNYGTNGVDVGYCINETNDQGFIIAGSMGFGGGNGYILKIDATGNVMWSLSASSVNCFYSIIQTKDGGYIATGYGGGTNRNIFLVKLSFSGSLLWSKSLGDITYEDVSYSVKQTRDNGFIIAGYTFGIGAGNYDAYLIKTDSLGNIVWSKTYGNANNDFFFSVQETADSGFIACGGYNSPPTVLSGNAYLVKTNAFGDILWTKYYSIENAYDVKQTTDSSFILVGYKFSNATDISLLKINSAGNIIWARQMGRENEDKGYFIAQTNDKGFFIAGETISPGSGNREFYLIKTDSVGNSNGCNTLDNSITSNNASTILNTGSSSGTGSAFTPVATTINTPPSRVNQVCGVISFVGTYNENISISTFPNPFTNHLTFTLSGTEQTLISLYNYLGQQVLQQKFIKSVTINTEQLPSGVYFYELKNSKKTVKSGKVIKK